MSCPKIQYASRIYALGKPLNLQALSKHRFSESFEMIVFSIIHVC